MGKYSKAVKTVSVITIFSVVSFFLSVILQMILAAKFGTRAEMDAYLTATSVPVVFISLLVSTFEVVFVPFLKTAELKNVKSDFIKFKNTIFSFLLLSLVIISILAIVFSGKFVGFCVPGFAADKKKLVEGLFKIITPSIVFGGLSGFLISIHYAQESFVKPALIKVVSSAIMLGVFYLFYPYLQINALALGFLLSYVAQFIILSPIMLKHEWHFCLDFKGSGLGVLLGRFSQMFIGGGILGLIVLFERFLASGLPEGSISYLGYAGKIISLLLLLPTAALPVILLPNLSHHFGLQDLDKLRQNLSLGIRLVFFIVFPICVFLYIFRIQFVYLLFEKGNFDKTATEAVAKSLVCYIGVFLGVSLASVTGKGFFAIQNTLVPAIIMVASFFLYVLISLPLSRLFSFMGLALSLSITILSGLMVDFFALRLLLNGIDGRAIMRLVFKVVGVSISMGIVMWFLYKNLSLPFIVVAKLSIFVKIALSSLVGLTAYLFLCYLFRIKEASIICSMLFPKFANRIRQL